jgi:NADPH:quinone reductase-like Zn-dependent oxidoreductase
VRVRACALNHVDMLLLDGRFPPPEGLPHVNGCEVTGPSRQLVPACKASIAARA